ncbi:MAG: ABATE domain-containing protein, partial [Gordonia sp. (in: high G+C Gram-positive bacteria)]
MVSLLVPADIAESPDQRRAGFPFRSGSVVLDFVATVAKRDLADRELLADPNDFERWVYAAGLPQLTTPPGQADLDRVHTVREALHRIVRGHVHDEPIARADIAVVNGATIPASPVARLGPDAREARSPSDVDSTAILSLIAREAVELFTGTHRERLRLCLGHDCSLYFVDRSRLGNRRWCSMAACGAKR